jgi:hypothetical protein
MHGLSLDNKNIVKREKKQENNEIKYWTECW